MHCDDLARLVFMGWALFCRNFNWFKHQHFPNRVNSGPQQLHFLFCLLDMMMWEADTTANTESDVFLGMTKVEHQLSSPHHINPHSHLSMSLISARFFHLCEKYSWYSDSGLSFDILLTTKTGNWSLETCILIDTQVKALAWQYLFLTVWIYCVFCHKTISEICMLPLLLHADSWPICYLLSVTAVPCPALSACPALSVTPGCCKSNITKQTSSDKHWRGVSCSIHFSTSCYHIMLLISHADKVRN